MSNGLEVTSNQNVIQTFTVGLEGLLMRVDLDDIRRHRGTAQLPLVVSLVTVGATGVPDNTVLWTQTLQPSAFGTVSGSVQLDVSSAALFVRVGESYGIKLATMSPAGGSTYAWGGDAPGGYAVGACFVRDNLGPLSFDLGFRTFVQVIGSVTSYGAGSGGTSGPPTLLASVAPARGVTLNLLCGNPQPRSVLGVLLFGAGRTSVATPFGGTLLVAPVATVGVTLPSSGTLALPTTVASDPSACGLVVDLQLLTIDASAAGGIGFSTGLELRIGS